MEGAQLGLDPAATACSPTTVLGTGPRPLSRQSKALQTSPLRAATAKGAGALESHHLGSLLSPGGLTL